MNKFLGGNLFIMKKQLNNDGISSLFFPFCWVSVIAGIFFSAAGRLDIVRAWLFFSIYLMGTIVGTIIAAVVGYACVRWMLAIVRTKHFWVFAPYCWLVGLAVIIWSIATA